MIHNSVSKFSAVPLEKIEKKVIYVPFNGERKAVSECWNNPI